MDSLVFFKWDFKKLIQKGMVMIMTKQEKIERFRKMNETIEKGQIVCGFFPDGNVSSREVRAGGQAGSCDL